ncbi:chymotrypsin-like [Drosophila biarmipes]|uniref:chymotrypsin-like n=1 Tax=Drosophila biarmipes TaxID=125945 RepID=UPI0007E6FC3C|nr:chymotrypsin-like [Drosophila biarmipes]
MMSKVIVGLTIFVTFLRFSLSSGNYRIVNGNYASAKQFPYQIFFDTLDLSNLSAPIKWQPTCGGTIISKRVILTAAHCLDNPNIYAIKIYFGAVNKSDDKEVGQQRLTVRRDHFVIHEKYISYVPYKPALVVNDVALIKLPIALLFDDYIRPAQLPDPKMQYEGGEVTVSGWGAEHVFSKEYKLGTNLKYFNAPLLSNGECQNRHVRYYGGIVFPSTLLCLAPGENMMCSGDSGGPLVIKHESNYVLLGVASYIMYTDIPCTPHYPAVYNRVTSYLKWIHDNAGSHNLA